MGAFPSVALALRENAVDSTSAVTSLAPSPSTTSTTTRSAPFLEHHLGAVVAAAAGAIAEAADCAIELVSIS
jgi:hypothetical protein